MKALISGSSGYLGSNLVPFLEEKGVEVVKYDITRDEHILDVDKLEEAMEGCSIIYHLAAVSNIGECERNREKAYLINVVGSKAVVDTAHRQGAKAVLFSTDVILGGSYYGALKKQMEVDNQERAVILRLTNVIGGVGYGAKRNVLWHFANDDPIVVHADAKTVDLIPMKQVLEACWDAVGYGYGVYDVESGLKIPVETLAWIFGAVRGVEVVVKERTKA